MTDLDTLLRNGEIFRISYTNAAQPGGVDFLVGFITGASAVRLTELQMAVIGGSTFDGTFTLFERTTFTGGAALTGSSRNLSYRGGIPAKLVASMASAVTATPLAANAVADRRLKSFNNGVISATGSPPDIILEPNTSYVLRMRNGDAQPADMSFTCYVFGEK